jgi:hypothetical protein
MCERLRFFEMTCESLFSLVFLKILGGRENSSKRLKRGKQLFSLFLERERERERSEEGKKEREKGKTTELENRERESARRERERERERRRERILISQSRRRIDWSRPLLSGFYILSQQHQRSA